MGIDLHIHTNCSDGDTSPQGIVQLAVDKGLLAIAITDHDTVEGLAAAGEAAQTVALEVVPGIELSTCWKGRAVHLLGYYFDPENEELRQGLIWIQEGRRVRNEQILTRLLALGCHISREEVLETAGPGLVGRPHFARLLVEKGYVGSMDGAFREYLGAGAKAYVPRRSMEVAEAVSLLHRAGGVAVIAHPSTLGYTASQLGREIGEMAALGVDGLEVFYPKHSRDFIRKLRKLAVEYSLITTGGSDYHGAVRPGISLAGGRNVFVADYILKELKQRHTEVCAKQLLRSVE